MIRVRAFSRLHFGVLNVAAVPSQPGRHFGGVGLMVREPGLSLRVELAAEWSAEGPLSGRALESARRFAQTVASDAVRPQRLVVEACAPEHVGLGTGTQLGLAVARALAEAWGLSDRQAPALAPRVGRGLRSGLGVHGFAHGGFLVEAGKRTPDSVAPLVARLAFPEDWRLVLIVPPWGTGLHGLAESQAFQHLRQRDTSPSRTDTLCRLILLGLLPALAEHDLPSFGEALYDFNRLVGESFAPVQGGVHASPRLEELVTLIRQQGVRGVAQSSWGPAVCAVTADADRAAGLADLVRRRFTLGPSAVIVTAACNRGAVVTP
jgi:beta-RFAP synthase